MTCRDLREMADSFLSGQLLTETNHDMLRHLETCPACRAEVEARRRLRDTLRGAYGRAPDLEPPPEFRARLRERVRESAAGEGGSHTPFRRWLLLAAGLVLAAGLAGDVFLNGSMAPSDVLARDAVGDHKYCALKFRLVRRPVPLEEAAERFDSAYRVLISEPPDAISTPTGTARVLERHSCVYGNRRFGHVVIQYQGRVVSLLMTASDASVDVVPRVIGRPAHGLSVVAVNGPRHSFLLVGDLQAAALTELSRAVSVPLAERLDAREVTQPPGSQLASWIRPGMFASPPDSPLTRQASFADAYGPVDERRCDVLFLRNTPCRIATS